MKNARAALRELALDALKIIQSVYELLNSHSETNMLGSSILKHFDLLLQYVVAGIGLCIMLNFQKRPIEDIATFFESYSKRRLLKRLLGSYADTNRVNELQQNLNNGIRTFMVSQLFNYTFRIINI